MGYLISGLGTFRGLAQGIYWKTPNPMIRFLDRIKSDNPIFGSDLDIIYIYIILYITNIYIYIHI